MLRGTFIFSLLPRTQARVTQLAGIFKALLFYGVEEFKVNTKKPSGRLTKEKILDEVVTYALAAHTNGIITAVAREATITAMGVQAATMREWARVFDEAYPIYSLYSLSRCP